MRGVGEMRVKVLATCFVGLDECAEPCGLRTRLYFFFLEWKDLMCLVFPSETLAISVFIYFKSLHIETVTEGGGLLD